MAESSSPSAEALADHLARAAELGDLLPRVEELARRLIEAFSSGGRLYTFGNGGSATEAQHLAEELVGRFSRERGALPAQCLSADPSVLTCIANDYSFDEVFERQVRAFVGAGDLAIGFSTSGRSQNVVRGLAAAQEAGATTALLGGGDGGPAASHADLALIVPSTSTARVQELHVLLVHLLLEPVDAWAASKPEGTG